MGIHTSTTSRTTFQQQKTRASKGIRLVTSPLRLLPDFIIIGGQRCGTTSLYEYLTDHPDIIGARRKEVHFFDNSFHRGRRWYTAHFPLAVERQVRRVRGRPLVTGEASPYYLFHPHAPRRIRRLVPSVKLIVLLRNPAERAYSHYHLSVKLGFETLPFEQALEAEAARLNGELDRMITDERYYSRSHQHHSYLSRGIYAEQLATWFEVFPREQLLIVRSEDFYRDPDATIRQVADFIGVDHIPRSAYDVHNSGSYTRLDNATRQYLRDYYAPHNQRLSEFTGIDFGWDRQSDHLDEGRVDTGVATVTTLWDDQRPRTTDEGNVESWQSKREHEQLRITSIGGTTSSSSLAVHEAGPPGYSDC